MPSSTFVFLNKSIVISWILLLITLFILSVINLFYNNDLDRIRIFDFLFYIILIFGSLICFADYICRLFLY